MQVRCEECGTTFKVEASATGTKVACPACMHEQEAERQDKVSWLEVEVRSATGKRLGLLDRHLVREQLYAGVLKGDEQVRAGGGEWVDIASRPEFADVLELTGVDLGSRRISAQALRGWRKTGSAIGAERDRMRRAAEGAPPVAEGAQAGPGGLPKAALIGGGVAVVVLLVIVALALLR